MGIISLFLIEGAIDNTVIIGMDHMNNIEREFLQPQVEAFAIKDRRMVL